MVEVIISWMLAALESASLVKHVGPLANKLYQRLQYSRVFRKAETALLNDPAAQFVAMPCPDEHMAHQIYALRHCFYAKATDMPEDALLLRYRHCPQAFHVVMKVSADSRAASFEGYYVLVPITDECVEAIARGHIQAGRHLRETDVVLDPKARVHAAYVSVVCGNGPRAQLATVNALVAEIDKLRRYRGLRFVFVRPTTSEGAYALRRYAGREFISDGKIQRVDLTTQGPALMFPNIRGSRASRPALVHGDSQVASPTGLSE
jgi:hypothetical protein